MKVFTAVWVYSSALVSVLSAQELVFESAFPQMPDKSIMETRGGRVTPVGDILEFTATKAQGKFPQASIVSDLPDIPFELTFDMKEIEGEPIGEGHIGVIVNGDAEAMRLYTRGQGIHIRTSKAGKAYERYHDLKHLSNYTLNSGKDADFNHFRMIVRENSVLLYVNGMFVANRELHIGAPRVINFNAWCKSMQVRKIRIQELDVMEVMTQQDPVVVGEFEPGASMVCNGKTIPSNTNLPCFKPGIKGNALDLSSLDKDLVYTIPKGNYLAGTLTLWVSPQTWGPIPAHDEGNHGLISLAGTDKQQLAIGIRHGLAVNFTDKAGQTVGNLGRRQRTTFRSGDWIHIAVTWEGSGRTRIYVNSLPYFAGMRHRTDVDEAFINTDSLSDIDKIVFPKSGQIAVDGLKLYRRALSPDEVWAEYRAIMPVDMTVFRTTLDASRDDGLSIQLAPGGYYMRPNPVKCPLDQAEVELRAELFDKESGQTVQTRHAKVNVDKPVDFKLGTRRFPQGDYLLVCTVNGTYTRSFDIFSRTVSDAMPESNAALTKARLVFEKTLQDHGDETLLCTGTLHAGKLGSTTYTEVSASKLDRMAFEVSFGEAFKKGVPYLLEIDWPDDKPRSMGLYLYLKTDETQHRDRLQGGIQSGAEYPESGEIQTVCYPFYAESDEYLFEARTMVSGMPAAISAIRIYETSEDRFPKLAIRRPAGEGRHFGLFDEDQTIDTSLPKGDKTTEALLDYMDYTGEDTLLYSILRYGYTFLPYEGQIQMALYPYGRFDELVESLGKRSKQFIGGERIFTIPEFQNGFWSDEYSEKGMLLIDKDGNVFTTFRAERPDISHPDVQDMLIRHYEDYVRTLGKNSNFAGVIVGPIFFWPSLDVGYGHGTLERFTQATGFTLPEEGRYEFLTTEKRKEWLKWRADVATGFVRELVSRIEVINPRIRFYVVPRGIGNPSESGVDCAALREIGPNVQIGTERNSTRFRGLMHYGYTLTDVEDVANRLDAPDWLPCGLVINMLQYFETRYVPLMPKKYACYFENADVKPHGRYYLKDMALSVASLDTLSYVHGGQPIGSWGRENEAREFARAYCALPCRAFQSSGKGIRDPVTVRYLKTDEGTYFYAVNVCSFPVTATLSGLSGACLDLSSCSPLYGNEIELKAFELRSFLLETDKNAEISCVDAVSPTAGAYYARKLAEIRRLLSTLLSIGPCEEEREVVGEIESHIERTEYAEAHRLIYSLPVREMAKKVGDREYILEEQKELKKHQIRLNCGSHDYYRAPDGRLFSPDRHYNGKSNHMGSLEGTTFTSRSIGGLGESDAPGVYATEAYDCPGYRFQLPNGHYKVKLYMKWGYSGTFKAGITCLTCTVQGDKLFENLDFFSLSKDFNKPHVFETTAAVTDGMLSIEFLATANTHPTSRFCNGIEITPRE